MSEKVPGVARYIVATVALGRGSVKDDVAQIVIDELSGAKLAFVRSVTVNREKQYISQLVTQVANSNEADVVIIIGGVGLGPRDHTVEAVDSLSDRSIEGFGEAFRRRIAEQLNVGISALLVRATAGVCNRCLVIALPRQPDQLRIAIRDLVLPIVGPAVRIASGGLSPAAS
jgi:molybdenum cofactor biosynthesis protein B